MKSNKQPLKQYLVWCLPKYWREVGNSDLIYIKMKIFLSIGVTEVVLDYSVVLVLMVLCAVFKMMMIMMMMNCFCGVIHRRKFPAGAIVREPHHPESPTCREQDLNLRRTWVQALLCSSDHHGATRYMRNSRVSRYILIQEIQEIGVHRNTR